MGVRDVDDRCSAGQRNPRANRYARLANNMHVLLDTYVVADLNARSHTIAQYDLQPRARTDENAISDVDVLGSQQQGRSEYRRARADTAE